MPFDALNGTDIGIEASGPLRIVWKFVGRLVPPRGRQEPAQVLALQTLIEAKSLINDRDRWTRGTYETLGLRRCATGALRTAATNLGDGYRYESKHYEVAHSALLRIAISDGFGAIETMNDRSSHGHVLRSFERAINSLRN